LQLFSAVRLTFFLLLVLSFGYPRNMKELKTTLFTQVNEKYRNASLMLIGKVSDSAPKFKK